MRAIQGLRRDDETQTVCAAIYARERGVVPVPRKVA
jgi:hypothetical protein